MGQEIVSIEQDVLYPVVLSDERKKSDAIFIFSRDDGEKEIAALASMGWRAYRDRNKLPFLIINGTTQEQWRARNVEFGGFGMWRELFGKEEIPDKYIIATKPAYHTGTEADELMRISQEHVLGIVTLVAMPYHILRCWLTAIKAMEKAQHYFDVYSLTLPSLFWGKAAPKVLLDGTFEQGTRLDHIAGEHARIKEYTAKGFCATRDEALAYLVRRGRR